MKYSLTLVQANGKHFPLSIDLDSMQEAESRKRWMQIGLGASDTHEIMPTKDLANLMMKDQIDWGCYTQKAIEDKIKILKEEMR